MGYSLEECKAMGIPVELHPDHGKASPPNGKRSKGAAAAAPRTVHERGTPYSGWPGRWEMVIPGWTPARDNNLMHNPLSAHRMKKRDVRIVGQAALALGVPTAFTRRRLTLEFRGRYGTFPDDTAYLKSLWDALVRNGLLVDDSREWLEFTWPPTYLRGLKQTRIILEDIGIRR